MLQAVATRYRVIAVSALLIVLPASVWAQGTTSLRGLVTDQQKAAVAGAKATLFENQTGVTHTSLTQSSGEYQFTAISPGTYSLSVEAPGFKIEKTDQIQLLIDTPATQNVTLQIGSSAQTVDVTADSSQLNTVNSSVGNTFQQQQIDSLPLQTRNVVELLTLQPGVTQNGEVMGARRDQNTITLDGVDSNDNQNALSGLNGSTSNQGFNSALPVPLDSVQEFRVTVAGQGATQGRSSGGQVSLVTRSGTNALHGSAYEFNRNTDFAANDWFSNRSGLARAQLIRNQFGASLGGPVKKDRIFFFLNYENRKDDSQLAVSRTLPTATLQSGTVLVKMSDGSIQSLSPADILAIDPLRQGVNAASLGFLKQYPTGNDPALGADQGLNFSGLLFNAPNLLNNRAYVGKFDWVLDSQAKNVVSFRGTLSNNNNTNAAAEFPGQASASEYISNNKGFALRETSTINSHLINVANLGLTRIGLTTTGATGTALSFGDVSNPVNYTRGSARINPVWNFNDDLTYIKGSHTITAGFNIRWINNAKISFSNSFPSYSFSRGILVGLGADIDADVLSYIQNRTGNSALKLANSTAVTNAFGDVLGLIDSLSVTYQYQKNGSTIPIGQPLTTDFITRNYEGYIQDSWKVNRSLTVTYGLRYQNDTPPYEANGLQVGTTPGLDQYFANRNYAAQNGIPGNQLPNGDLITYSLNGPVNGKGSWFQRDNNNLAPRLSVAWAPNATGFFSNMVIRAGASMVYDQYGNDLVANVASLGSVGLATSLGFPASYNFSTSPRYNGVSSLPALPTAPQGGFPYTPPNISSISGTYYGISPSLVDPYSYLLNFTVSKEFKHTYTIDLSYVGRLSHKLLLQEDAFAPLINFKDPKSGITWTQADTVMRQLYNNGGVSANQVKANPSLVPTNQFVEDLFPSLTNYYFKGSASANYFYGIYGTYGGSDLDNLHSLDRIGAPNNCMTATGCYTFFAPQGSADPTWTNAGQAAYHAFAFTFRRALKSGFGFDFNYTWSHSIDNSSSAADNAGEFGGVLQNSFLPGLNRGDSDFDIRNQFNMNIVYALPFGRGQHFANTSSKWLDEIIGGWQVSSLIRYHSGLPTTISGSGVFPTNYWESSIAIPNGTLKPVTGVGYDQLGNPSLFRTTAAIGDYQDAYPGGDGQRAILRLPGYRDVDLAVQKDFRLPWEGHKLQFRAEAFNAFNFVNFSTVSLSLANSGTFGEFSADQGPRVMQLSLRYSF